jgi:hypothetical protein
MVEHDDKKWMPVFVKNRAKTNIESVNATPFKRMTF